MRVSVFIATSLDGFIARENGAIDWLPLSETSNEAEDYGYQAFFDSIEAIAMGRHTYELVCSFDAWPYGDKRVFVLSHQNIQIPAHLTAYVTALCAPPEEVYRYLGEQDIRHLYVDGGKTIQGFLQAGLIDYLTISQIPILIGSGIPLFGPLPQDVTLQLIRTQAYPSGVVQNQYLVVK